MPASLTDIVVSQPLSDVAFGRAAAPAEVSTCVVGNVDEQKPLPPLAANSDNSDSGDTAPTESRLFVGSHGSWFPVLPVRGDALAAASARLRGSGGGRAAALAVYRVTSPPGRDEDPPPTRGGAAGPSEDEELSPEPGGSGGKTLYIKFLSGKTLTASLPSNATVLDVKLWVYEEEGIADDMQRLIVAGRQRDDDECISEWNEGQTVHNVTRPQRGG